MELKTYKMQHPEGHWAIVEPKVGNQGLIWWEYQVYYPDGSQQHLSIPCQTSLRAAKAEAKWFLQIAAEGWKPGKKIARKLKWEFV